MSESIEKVAGSTTSGERKSVPENQSPSDSSISSEKPASLVDGEHDAETKQQLSLAVDSDKAESQAQAVTPPPYTAFSPWRRRFILGVTAVAGFFGPLAGGIYLPALPVLEEEFHVGATAINATVSVFMLTFAFAVSHLRGNPIAPAVSSRSDETSRYILALLLIEMIAPHLVQFRGLEGSAPALYHFYRRLHCRKYPSRRCTDELRCFSLPAHCTGVRLRCGGVNGRGNRRRCSFPNLPNLRFYGVLTLMCRCLSQRNEPSACRYFS